ncbi:Vancomycin resistance protein YoaR, contains peptidoglycan-binding and VanW domains [Paenibacillus sp. UNCCL117]|uniref:VanW family protein n=1 Tax=unclassified Paenibacillus TaxID=185978 RepID=UPI00087E97B8|nr:MULTISPECIES: VanW family protein [unclassified Paenibacillus]SDE50773.1 Vancomycin resistance protein YoaR, contains peptidoglycan-binding and VanW domains [Paenibacillus sp. cl123]SFW67286.1 Vancomycin resistance protein YoaR, contains peptidoglycan-binding and VanW domains [Paenibacillus sp. UNCCL117]
MPSSARLARPLLIAALTLAAAGFGGTALYGSSTHMPHRLHVGKWDVGGLTFQEFETQLAERRDAFLALKTALKVEQRTGADPGGAARRSLGELGVDVNIQALLERTQPLRQGSLFQRAKARFAMRGESWPAPPALAADKLSAALQQSFPDIYRNKPKDATRVIRPDDTVDYISEVQAVRPDEQATADRLLAALPPWELLPETLPELSVPLSSWGAAVTVQSLREQGIVRKIGEFSTLYPPAPAGGAGSAAGRLHNVQSTAASLHDVLLPPGAVFDYAPFIEQTEKAMGYREAPVIVNGKLVPGVGGGICQVSSTLYNAVLRAGLEVVERRNHSLPVSYVPLGQDATFASGHINFKFRNNTPHHLLIRTQSDDRGLTVKLFGQTPAEFTYEVESRTLEKLEPPTKYVHNPTLARGKQVLISKGKPGYVVETYRIKKQQGIEVGREKVSRDTYSAQPTVIATNSGEGGSLDRSSPAPGGGAPYVEDGVKGPTFR